MPGAVIVLNQDRPGGTTSFGSPGVARNDLWLGHTVRPTVGTSGNSSYSWEFLDIPAGSAAVITSADQATCAFTADLPGSYRLQLETNGGGPGNVQILIAAFRYDSNGTLINRGWRVPALGESGTAENNFDGQSRGWSESYETVIADLLASLGGGGGLSGLGGDDNGKAKRLAFTAGLHADNPPPTALSASFGASITGVATLRAYISGAIEYLMVTMSDGTYKVLDTIQLTTVYTGTMQAGSTAFASGSKFYLIGPSQLTVVYPDGVTSNVVVNSATTFGGFATSLPGTQAGVQHEILLLTAPNDDLVYAYDASQGSPLSVVLTLSAGSKPSGIVFTQDGSVWVALIETDAESTAVLKRYTPNGSGALTYSGVTVTNFLADGQIISDGRFIWGVESGSPGKVHRVRLSDFTLTTINLSSIATSSSSVVFDGESIWVSAQSSLYRIHPDTLEVLSVTPITSSPPTTLLSMANLPGAGLFIATSRSSAPQNRIFQFRTVQSLQLDRLRLLSASTPGWYLKINANGELVGAAVPPPTVRYTLQAGAASTVSGSGSPATIGGVYIDPADWPAVPAGMSRKIYLRCILETSDGARSANIDLLDQAGVATGTPGTEVTSSNLSTTDTSPHYLSAELTQLEAMVSAGIFLARLWINPADASHTVTCLQARIDVVVS